jgi:hypothetical protein
VKFTEEKQEIVKAKVDKERGNFRSARDMVPWQINITIKSNQLQKSSPIIAICHNPKIRASQSEADGALGRL